MRRITLCSNPPYSVRFILRRGDSSPYRHRKAEPEIDRSWIQLVMECPDGQHADALVGVEAEEIVVAGDDDGRACCEGSGNDVIIVRIVAHRREKRQLGDDVRHGEKIFDIVDDVLVQVTVSLAEPGLVPENPTGFREDVERQAELIAAGDTGTDDSAGKAVWLEERAHQDEGVKNGLHGAGDGRF
jgi:hypothetical protein